MRPPPPPSTGHAGQTLRAGSTFSKLVRSVVFYWIIDYVRSARRRGRDVECVSLGWVRRLVVMSSQGEYTSSPLRLPPLPWQLQSINRPKHTVVCFRGHLQFSAINTLQLTIPSIHQFCVLGKNNAKTSRSWVCTLVLTQVNTRSVYIWQFLRSPYSKSAKSRDILRKFEPKWVTILLVKR